MATDTATTRFPNYLQQVRELVEEHKKLDSEPLLLAIYYAPSRDPDDIFLFEVIENFGSNSRDQDQELFEVAYDSTAQFSLPPGKHLRMILTNPVELRAAAREQWPALLEVREAVRDGRAIPVWESPSRPDLIEVVRG